MALTKTQEFLEKEFSKQTRIAVLEIVNHCDFPKDKAELYLCIYAAMMTGYQTAFECEKIIVKNSPKWDSLG